MPGLEDNTTHRHVVNMLDLIESNWKKVYNDPCVHFEQIYLLMSNTAHHKIMFINIQIGYAVGCELGCEMDY